MVGETVVFDSGNSHDPDGNIVSYVWDFGDGASQQARSGESTVAHTYNSAGTYQVRLTVTDDGGLSDTATHTIVIEAPIPNQPPVARINGPSSAMAGETVIFDSSGSHDPDGTIDSYVWDFGDGGSAARARSGDSTVAHTYNSAGTYRVTLTVTDNDGASNTATHPIVISEVIVNQPPRAVINGPTKGLVTLMLTFDGSISSDPDGSIVSYAWNFGDGTTANGVTVNHSYSTAGNYNVVLTVTDDGGLSDRSTYTVVIEESLTKQPDAGIQPR
jgi:PKD repeat protein